MVTLAAILAVAMCLAALTGPAAARYLPTKRGSGSGAEGDRLDRLAHLIKELLAESDSMPTDHAAFDQRVFYKREAPFPYPEAKSGAAAPAPSAQGLARPAAQ